MGNVVVLEKVVYMYILFGFSFLLMYSLSGSIVI